MKVKLTKDDNIFGVPFFKDEVLEATQAIATNTGKPFEGHFDVMRNGKRVGLSTNWNIVLVPDSTPVSEASKEKIDAATKESNKIDTGLYIASAIGTLAGLGYAFHKKKKVWGYVGFAILGSITGSLIYHIGKSVVKKKQ